MIESGSFKDTNKNVEKKSENTSESFLNKLEKFVEIPKTNKVKISERLKELEDDTDNLVTGKENTDVRDDKELSELREEYIKDLKEKSEYPDTIEDDNEPYEKISPEKNAEMRDEFDEKREELIKEWEEKNGKEWPRYKEDVYDEKTGTLIRKAGDRYDAHHIHPLSLGGKNTVDNITPVSAEKHYDKRGVHASDSPYSNLEKQCKGGGA